MIKLNKIFNLLLLMSICVFIGLSLQGCSRPLHRLPQQYKDAMQDGYKVSQARIAYEYEASLLKYKKAS